jgi:hypothetical protein
VSFFSGLSAARTPSPSEWLGVCMQGGWRQVLALNGFQGAHVYWPAELSPLRQAQLPGQGSVTEEEKSKTGQPTLEPGKGIACHWPGCLLGLWMKERGHPPLAFPGVASDGSCGPIFSHTDSRWTCSVAAV